MATKSLPAAHQQPSTLRYQVGRMALPAVGEQFLNTLVGLADTYFVGNLSLEAMKQLGYSSDAALAGVGLAGWILWLMTVFFGAVGVGCTALIARAKGAHDIDGTNRVLHQSMLIGIIMGIIAAVAATLFATQFIELLGAQPDVLPLGVEFLQIAGPSLAPAALLFVAAAALRGVGDTRTPLYVMLGVNGINIILSWLLVNGNLGAPALGVSGTAVAAGAARTCGGLALLVVLFFGRSGLKLSLDLRPDRELLRRIVRVGLPSGAEQLVFQSALLFFVRFITGLGTAAYAAHNVVINIESLSFLPGMGYAIAASALVGQRLGAQRSDEAQASTYEALRQGGLMMTVLGIIMMLFPQELLMIFIPNASPAVIEAGTPAMRIAGAFQPVLAINFIISGALRGAGDTRWPLYTKIISTWGVRLPLVWLLTEQGMGLTGVWLTMAADFAIQAVLAFWRFQKGTWKTMNV